MAKNSSRREGCRFPERIHFLSVAFPKLSLFLKSCTPAHLHLHIQMHILDFAFETFSPYFSPIRPGAFWLFFRPARGFLHLLVWSASSWWNMVLQCWNTPCGRVQPWSMSFKYFPMHLWRRQKYPIQNKKIIMGMGKMPFLVRVSLWYMIFFLRASI